MFAFRHDRLFALGIWVLADRTPLELVTGAQSGLNCARTAGEAARRFLKFTSVGGLLALATLGSAHAQTELWRARYNTGATDIVGNGTAREAIGAVAIDSIGNTYVTGISLVGAGNNDYLTVKYNAAGVLQWATTTENPAPGSQDDHAFAVGVDGSGNVYVSGYSTYGPGNNDYLTAKYNSAGIQQWAVTFDNPAAGTQNDIAYALAVDSAGSSYVTGQSHSGSNYNYVTVKYNTAGAQQWASSFNGAGNSDDIATALVVDGSGNVYVTGQAYQGFPTGWDFATIMYNSFGVQQWTALLAGPFNFDVAFAVALDGSGNSYVTGYTQQDSSTGNYLTAKYNSGGALQWSRSFENSAVGTQHETANSLAVDSGGNVYVTGWTATAGVNDYMTVKYNSAGVQQWAVPFDNPSPGSQDDVAFALGLDGLGNVYVTGKSHNGVNYDFVTLRYDADGTQVWAATADGGGNDYGVALKVSSGGGVVVAGTSEGSGQDYMVLKYASAVVDSTPPTDPTIDFTSPGASVWSTDNTVEVTWSGATDEVDGSGLAGYSIEWNTTPISSPDAIVDIAHAADPHSTTSPALGDGSANYFHLSTCDNAGNCTSTVHAGPFWIDTTAPTAPGAITSSSHEPTGAPVSDDTIDVAWGAASDLLSGVASNTYAFDGNPTGSCAGSSTVSLSATSAALADGSWFVHVCAVDLAGNMGGAVDGGPYVVDTAGPTGLAVSSTSHTVSTWSNDNSIDFVFSGSTDANGVAGYAIELDQGAATLPACATTQAVSTFTGSGSPDGNDWWIHVRARDQAANCGDTVHLGPFRIDTTEPNDPTTLVSTSHTVSQWSSDRTVDLEWSGATDATSGLAGYSLAFVGGSGSGYAFSWGDPPGSLHLPNCLATDSFGNVYVGDVASSKISKFSPAGSLLAAWSTRVTGSGVGAAPAGLAVGADGVVYVADGSNHRITRFDASGNFLGAWGQQGSAAGELTYPGAVAVDTSGYVYVTDGNNRVQKFTASGTFILGWGSYGTGTGQFDGPSGVAVAAGVVYVADFWNRRIQKFDSSGGYLGQWGTYGTGDGQFVYPTYVATDPAANVLVTDFGTSRVQKFDPAGLFLAKWGAPGSADGQFVDLAGVTVAGDGFVYVADRGNNRVQKFDGSGTFIQHWGHLDGALTHPHGLAASAAGEIFVADVESARVQKFGPAGNFLAQWGTRGSAPGQFRLPWGIAVDGAGDVYVSDLSPNRAFHQSA